MDFYLKLNEFLNEGRSVCIVTVVDTKGSTPQKIGSKMVVDENGLLFGTIGGGAIEFKIINESKNVLINNNPKLITINLTTELGMCCGGEMTVFIEPIAKKTPLYIFGAGHISKEFAPMAVKAGFRVTVIDDRKEFANKENFPTVQNIIVDDFLDYLKKFTFNSENYMVIVTRGHSFDEEILRYCIDKEYHYLGMVSSRHKLNKFKDRFLAYGFNENHFKKIHSPIGLDINAKSPFEIAVSIMSEIIKIKNAD